MTQQIKLCPLSGKENLGAMSPSKEMRKLKIELSDKIFELRKIEQDYAEEKALLVIQFNQQKTLLSSSIRDLKQKVIDGNEHWSQKIDELRGQNSSALKRNNEQWLSQIDELVNDKLKTNKESYEQKIQQMQTMRTKLEQTLSSKQKQHSKAILQLKQINNNKMALLKQEKQKEFEQLKAKMIKDQHIKISAVMHIKNNEEKQHNLTKKLLAQKEKELENNVSQTKKRVYLMNQEIWRLKRQVERLQNENKRQSEQIVAMEDVQYKILQGSNKQSQEKIIKLEQESKTNIDRLNQNWKKEFNKVIETYEKLNAACIQKQKLWQERANKMFNLCGKRESKDEDVKMIEQLEVKLIRKDFELERQRQQVKFCKLQIDNMDDIYKRIFHSGPKNSRNSFMSRKMKLPIIINRSTQPLKGPDSS